FTNTEDFGTLVKNGNGTYTYTAKDQTQWNFSSAGLLTSVVAPTGLTLSYTYTNGLLTGVTPPDQGTTTLTYTPAFLTSISEPGSRPLTLTQTVSSGKSTLTQITDVDSTVRTLGYNTSRQLTSDSWSPLASTFSFNGTTGLLTGVTLGTSPNTEPYTIVS